MNTLEAFFAGGCVGAGAICIAISAFFVWVSFKAAQDGDADPEFDSKFPHVGEEDGD